MNEMTIFIRGFEVRVMTGIQDEFADLKDMVLISLDF
jgi:dihydroneopterin aldolase